MHEVARVWPGETVAILATGPSLTEADVAAVRGRVRVLAVNDAIRIAPWADALFSSDARWWRYNGGVPSYRGPKFAIGQIRERADGIPFADVGVLTNTGIEGLDRNPSGLRTGEHSGYAAINLAVHFGAARIVLLGYDLGTSPGAPSHFFGQHPAGLEETNAPMYARFRGHYRSIVADLAALGVEVVNCTPASRLDVFPIRSLADVLAEAVVCR